MKVALKHPASGVTKNVGVGFSWTLLLFSGAWGIPLFMRGLHALGLTALVMWIITFSLAGNPEAETIWLGMNLVFVGFIVYMAMKGNELTARQLLAAGYEFASPDGEFTRFAKARWGIA